ncbi:hypothetical protein PLESTF_000039300 [Pleodorina starrii]|nr:hypothetical protein PLESTF_000039300 [Pleodorina starrii]
MSKFRFREYDALGLWKKVPGDQVPSAHHISKRKLKQKDVEVVFDVKDYKDYVTGFRKRKQQRRQDAMKQIKDKQRLERNQQRSEKRTELKERLGLGDDYGVGSSSDDGEEDDAAARPQSVTVYQGEGGMTTTVTTMALQSSDDEQPQASGSDGGEEDDDDDDGEAGPGAGQQQHQQRAAPVGEQGRMPPADEEESTARRGSWASRSPASRQRGREEASHRTWRLGVVSGKGGKRGKRAPTRSGTDKKRAEGRGGGQEVGYGAQSWCTDGGCHRKGTLGCALVCMTAKQVFA